jgi:CheY-like chemotaxis protein
MAIHEVLAVTDDIRDLISSRAGEHVIKKAARRAGMRTLLEDGIEKAARGLTTLDEVLRVVSRGDATDRASDTAPGAHAPGGDVVDAGPATRGGRVLVVEDSPTIVSVVKYFLELEGFEVFVAENGLLGLEMAVREQPDVIVSDVNMPGMGGVEMVKALRDDPRTSQVRILMLTSESSVESETEGLAAGADDYILKPVEPRRLAARVKALRARSRPTAA